MNSMARAQVKILVQVVLTVVLICGLPAASLAGYSQVEPLWFSISPADGVKPEAGHGGRPGSDGHGSHTGGRPSGRPSGSESGRPSGRPGGGRPAGRFESEHRPIPVRKYYLNGPLASAEGLVLHPDLSVSDLALNFEGSASGSIKMDMGDGPHHGAHNLYAFDNQVVGATRFVRNAKWVTIQHSCGWGHKLKFTEERQKSNSLATVPLEIVVDDLWDTSFHSTVMSGDIINLKVLNYGKPAPRARVTIISEKGWQKTVMTDENGHASFQMVRDYYPEEWSKFHRTEKGQIKFRADYKSSESGELNGQAFDDTKYIATFTWRYFPARREYTNVMVGLLVALFGAGLTGAGFFFYRRKRWTGLKRLAWNE